MERIDLPYRSTRRFSPLALDYVENAAGLRDFRSRSPDRAGLEGALAERQFDPASRAVLCHALERQYEGISISTSTRANLDALSRPDTFTVTTGHQLCLFSGPLYVPFKILNVIRLARELSRADRKVVPVFWMATEDHDRAEIDHTFVHGTKVVWAGEAGGAVGPMELVGIEAVVEQAAALLGDGTHADEMRSLLRSCYRSDRTLAQATRLFVNALFGRSGLVIIDGDDRALKRLFAPLMQEELLNSVTERTVTYASEKLGEGYTLQAHAREINLFYLRPGQRSRIVHEGERYQVLEGGPSFSLDELLIELELRPERFSPNVLLRPIYQETILPNIAYVGGGGEIAYWLQLRWLFQGLQVPMPVLMLRTSAMFLSSKRLQQWKALGLGVVDLFSEREALRTQVARSHVPFLTDTNLEQDTASALYDGLLERLRAVDPTLEAAGEARKKRALRDLRALGMKLIRAAKRQQSEPLERMERVLDSVLPGGGLQERQEGLLAFHATHGPAWLDELLDKLDPLDPNFSVLVTD